MTQQHANPPGGARVVVFDMDNTLLDSFGSEVRPGIVALLLKLKQDGCTLVLWTNSRRDRAMEILREHDLRRHFKLCICREDYDPEERDVPKDIRRVKGDILVDDDPEEVRYVRSIGRRGFLIRPHDKGAPINRAELTRLYAEIRRPKGIFGKLFG
jgi:phosphoglycolate phosphatase-like HAD superfamily hydrolase